MTAGTASKEEVGKRPNSILLGPNLSENRIGDPDNKHNFVYQYQLHSLSRRGVTTVCKTTYVIIAGISVTAIDYAERLVRKNTSAESIILKGYDERSRKQESFR